MLAVTRRTSTPTHRQNAGLRVTEPCTKEEHDMNDVPVQPQRRGGRGRLLIGGACAAVVALSIATTGIAHAEADRTITSNSTGTHNGFYYSYWKDTGNVTMTLGAGGNYSVSMNSINNSVVGKGWNPAPATR
jgi:endo-1,4-beta-xylanase